MPELQEILVEEMRDLYDAEKQLTKALPRMAKAVTHPELKQAFLDHTEMTKNQAARLEQAFELLGERAKSKPCKAMKGLIEEANEHVSEHEKGPMLDTVLIGAAQKVEHYEISGYGTARTLAKAVGQKEVAALLDETAKEEGMTDKLLTSISVKMLKELKARPEVDEEDKGMSRGGRGKSGGMGGSKKKVAAKSGRSGGNGASRGAIKGQRTESLFTTDHEDIQRWAEERGAKPACVRKTGRKGDIGMIRLDFPGYSGAQSLEEITWDEWFQAFDENGLALLYQEHTAGGEQSNFNKLVSRGTVEKVKGGRARK